MKRLLIKRVRSDLAPELSIPLETFIAVETAVEFVRTPAVGRRVVLWFLTEQGEKRSIVINELNSVNISPANTTTAIDVVMGNDTFLEDVAAVDIMKSKTVAYMRDGGVHSSIFSGGIKYLLVRAKPSVEEVMSGDTDENAS